MKTTYFQGYKVKVNEIKPEGSQFYFKRFFKKIFLNKAEVLMYKDLIKS